MLGHFYMTHVTVENLEMSYTMCHDFISYGYKIKCSKEGF